ncbi:SH3 domain-binding glutamic acid-rich-like protein 3 [Dysidea avara]|uniref:SH3 domain-binding glutamic acid-rich-like protein 3 n=1 Tax=Dysidea avara TaxID=196820 RepID=UPI0033336640
MATIVVYVSTVAGSLDVKKQQQRIEMILGKTYQGNEVKYIDVAADEDAKKKMRDIIGDEKAVPPQIFNGDTYCGNFQKFDDAVEDGELKQFLKL